MNGTGVVFGRPLCSTFLDVHFVPVAACADPPKVVGLGHRP